MANKGARKNTMDDSATRYERKIHWHRIRKIVKDALRRELEIPRFARRGW